MAPFAVVCESLRSTASFASAGDQKEDLVRAYPEPQEHPFPVRRPEDPEEDQPLYRMPGYRYPHSLTFLDDYTPEDEARIIQDFETARGQTVPPPVPAASSFRSALLPNPVPPAEMAAKDKGWGRYAVDLTVMCFVDVLEACGVPIRRPYYYENSGGEAPEVKPTPRRRKPRKPVRRLVRNGGNPNSILPTMYPDPHGVESDTEIDDGFTQKYLTKLKNPSPHRPIETVFGPGVTVNKSFGGTLRGRVEDDARVTPATEDGGDIKYPTLPNASSESSFPFWGDSYPPPSPVHPATPSPFIAHAAMQEPLRLPVVAPPPGISRLRHPGDTVFGQTSAGSMSQSFPSRPKSISGLQGMAPRKITSGSFGSFGVPPSRFDERPYKLLPKITEEDERGGQEPKRDRSRSPAREEKQALRDRPWLRRH